MNHNNNKLLTNYHNHQNNNKIIQNNMLLQNNPSAVSQQNIQKLKEQQYLKQLEKINELDVKYNKEKIRESVIKPINTKVDNKDVVIQLKRIEGEYTVDNKKKLWKERTNQPYKNILKNENYNKKFEKKEDLIVHKITQDEKDAEKIEKNYKQLESTIEKHNDELKIIYHLSKEAEHKQKFAYTHKYKYQDTEQNNDNEHDHNSIKKNRIDYFKRQQQKEEENKQQKDNILETIINEGIFSVDELKNVNNKTGTPSNPDANSNDNATKNRDKYNQRLKNK
jgi:hypothetical protein